MSSLGPNIHTRYMRSNVDFFTSGLIPESLDGKIHGQKSNRMTASGLSSNQAGTCELPILVKLIIIIIIIIIITESCDEMFWGYHLPPHQQTRQTAGTRPPDMGQALKHLCL